MTRIGKVTAYEGHFPAHPYFRLVVENGAVQLGCWRAVALDPPDWAEQNVSPRTVFVRIS